MEHFKKVMETCSTILPPVEHSKNVMETCSTAFVRALRMLLMAQSELDRAVLQRRANQMKQLAPDMPREDMMEKIQETSAQDDIEKMKEV